MAGPNTSPIYSRVGDIEGSMVFTAAANDYVGQAAANAVIFVADATNGAFVQKIRFKALGTNVATVARIYLNKGTRSPKAPVIAAVAGTPTGTPSGTGGTLQAGSFFAKVYAIDQYGSRTAAATETAAVAVTGTTGSIAWAWTAVTGASSYNITVGLATGQQVVLFSSNTNSFSQTAPGTPAMESDLTNNNYFFGEVGLPAITASATSATIDIDYPMNFALPPGSSIICGLGTAVAAGWVTTVIAGAY